MVIHERSSASLYGGMGAKPPAWPRGRALGWGPGGKALLKQKLFLYTLSLFLAVSDAHLSEFSKINVYCIKAVFASCRYAMKLIVLLEIRYFSVLSL